MPILTYCTNVHPLDSLPQWKDTISYFGPKIRNLLKLDQFSLGLWFNNRLIHEILHEKSDEVLKTADLLQKNNLSTVTFNGFPYGNFHQKVVKTQVYLPKWSQKERLDYTKGCATLLAQLMPAREEKGSISTLPLGWKKNWEKGEEALALENLEQMVEHLRAVREKTGKEIRLCLEPEPGCVLERTHEVVDFWERMRGHFKRVTQEEIQTFLGVCYDTCHQAVQFEGAVEALKLLQKWEIPIGKMQLSNGLEFPEDADRKSLESRRLFCEEKFLHQTRILHPDQSVEDFDDLPLALKSKRENWKQPWRSHFHLPLFADQYIHEGIKTTHQEMLSALQYSLEHQLTDHYEVETYTWSVLPKGIRPEGNETLAEGITRELQTVLPYFKGEVR